tara:strand:+ start:67 stop:441 length:375 start_codon:yes stop_codon:yes gene_type:complete
MKLTTKRLRMMIKEELAKEGAVSWAKDKLGMGPEKGSKEAVRAQIKKVNELAIELNAAVEEVRDMAMQTGDLQRDLDRDDQFGDDSVKALDDMLQITKAAVEMSSDLPGPGHDFVHIGNLMSPI